MSAVAPNPNPIFKYPLNLDGGDGEYNHYIQFTAQRYRASAGSASPNGSVSLYMTGDSLKTTYGQAYGDSDLGALGNLVNEMDSQTAQSAVAQMGAGQLGKLDQTLNSALGKGFSERVTTALKESTAKATKDAMAGMMGGAAAGATAALQNVLGKVINPHKAVVYSGPGGFRTFSYTFTMTPESPAEAEMIANIVYFFKYHMHPGVDSVAGTAASSAGPVSHQQTPATQESSTFTYPDEFTIRLFANKQEVSTPTTSKKPALFKINKCFLENLTTDFTTSGQPAFFQDSGTPVTTTLGLTFKETVLVTRNSIGEGY